MWLTSSKSLGTIKLALSASFQHCFVDKSLKKSPFSKECSNRVSANSCCKHELALLINCMSNLETCIWTRTSCNLHLSWTQMLEPIRRLPEQSPHAISRHGSIADVALMERHSLTVCAADLGVGVGTNSSAEKFVGAIWVLRSKVHNTQCHVRVLISAKIALYVFMIPLS